MPASTFDGVNIRVALDPSTGSSPAPESTSYVTVRHIPGSNNDVIQVLGIGYPTVTHELLLDATEYTALLAKRLVTGTLVVAGVSQGAWLLESIGAPRRHVNGWTTVSAQFRKAGP